MFNGRNARQTYVNIWSLFSKSFTPMVWHFTGFAIGMMLNFWVTNQHLWTCDDICIINTSIQIYSLLISTIQYLYPHIYIYIMYFCLPFIKSRGSRFPRRWIPLWEATSRGAAKTEEQRHHTDCVGTKHVILAIKSEKLSHKKGKTQP